MGKDRNRVRQGFNRTVTVVGGGVSGMSAACALAEAGFRVRLVERRGYLGGRASSYLHPGVGEVIDNCQHVLFGCCTNLIGFYSRIGALAKVRWSSNMTMIEPGGRRSTLGPSSALPAPLHGVPKLLSAAAFTLADKLALARAFQAMLQPIPAGSTETLAAWLRRNRQTSGAVERFWKLVIASALNAEIECIAVPYAAKVIRELFMNSAEAGKMGINTVPLSDLYADVPALLARHNSELHLNCNVEALEWDEETSQWSLTTRQGPLASQFLVLALPFEAMAKLLPKMPPAEKVDELARKIARHEHWPICSAHLWFDREITDLDHAVMLDREIHWLFNRSRLQPWRSKQGSYVEIEVSASRIFAARERNEAIALTLRELAEFFPAVTSAKLQKAALVKEVRATFGVPPEIDSLRPSSVAPWPNCFLAGDWTATGWPSTMESAARSGHLAAEGLCAAIGEPQTFLVPDLKPRGFMRLLAR
ncbi:MAG TPA: hydroxysqualene dehydroxylase HpnE [Terracidiphilus sp.]|nr:hydroxysqualene dehydroxylase HpnE [Terracidiphilus sp.]